MSKSAEDIFPNLSPIEAQATQIMHDAVRKFRRRQPLNPQEQQMIEALGLKPEHASVVNGMDFIHKYGSQGMPDANAKGSYREVKEAFGYHLKDIPRGKYGERSKILEEMSEVEDAHAQSNWIMFLLELSDLVGATIGYLKRYTLTLNDLRDYSDIAVQPLPFASLKSVFDEFRNPGPFLDDVRRLDQTTWTISCVVTRWNLTFDDILRMTLTTHRAFENGHRSPKVA